MNIKNYLTHLLLAFVGSCLSASLLALPMEVKHAIQAFDQPDLEKAQTYIDQATQDSTYQQQASTWYYRGVIYDQLMRKHITSDSATSYLDEALQAYQKTLTFSQKDIQYHSFAQINIQRLWAYYVNRGVQYYKVEAFEEALEQLAISTKITNNAPNTLLYIAIAAQQAEKYEIALQHYEQYIQLGHAEPAVYQALANLTVQHVKKPAEAQEILYTALQKYPWDINLLAEIYQLLAQTNQIETRQAQLQAQLEELPTMPTLYYQLAYWYTQSNKWEEAATNYQKAAELAPQQVDPVVQLATLYYNQSAQILHSVIEMPEEIFQQTGKEAIEKATPYLEKSLQYFEKANKLTPRNIYILKPLYILYTRLNQAKKAAHIAHQMKQLKGGSQLLEELDQA